MQLKESRKKVDRKAARKLLKTLTNNTNPVWKYNKLWEDLLKDTKDRADQLVPSDTGELKRSVVTKLIKKRGIAVGFEIGYNAEHAATLFDSGEGDRRSSIYIQDSPAVRSHDRTYTGKGNRRRRTIKVKYPNGRVFPDKKRVVYWEDKDNTTGRRDGKYQFYTTDKPIPDKKVGYWLTEAYKEIYQKTSIITKRLLTLPENIEIRVNPTSRKT
tara:strand:- start:699 stop:1340 length:642 start_codon:yes stop_codon:yes gene_type:complete